MDAVQVAGCKVFGSRVTNRSMNRWPAGWHGPSANTCNGAFGMTSSIESGSCRYIDYSERIRLDLARVAGYKHIDFVLLLFTILGFGMLLAISIA